MRSGRTLVSLAQELERQLHSKKDLVVPSQLVHHSTGDGGETHLVSGEDIYVNADATTRKPTPVPDFLREAIARFERIQPAD